MLKLLRHGAKILTIIGSGRDSSKISEWIDA